MFFKNLQIYTTRLTLADAPHIEAALRAAQFQPCGSQEATRSGWVPPRAERGLLYAVPGTQHALACLQTETRILPASVINRAAAEKAAKIEAKRGYKVGRREMRELKGAAMQELMPRAFTRLQRTLLWFDFAAGRIVVDTSSASRAAEDVALLIGNIECAADIKPLQVFAAPSAAMDYWIANDDPPSGFGIDNSATLRSAAQSAVRYTRHNLCPEEMRAHIAAGKQCTRLAMTWRDRISFVLTDEATVLRVDPLDVISSNLPDAADADDFDGSVVLMAGELRRLINDIVAALGGLR